MLCWTVHLKVPRLILHAAVAVSHRVYSFGGYGHETAHAESQVDDGDRIGVPIGVHVFNTVSLCWTRLPVAAAANNPPTSPPPDVTAPLTCPPEVPSHRVGLTAALIDGMVYIWGGLVNYWIEEADNGELTIYGKHCNALYTFDVQTHRWARPDVSGTVPEGRSVHSACVLGRVMYVLGGHKNQVTAFNDVHALDTAAMRWHAIDARGTPAPRAFGNSATIIGTRIFVFGGRWETRHYRSVSVFDTETDCWMSTPAPPMLTPDANVSPPRRRPLLLLPEARMNHSAVAHGGRLYVFGGDNNPQDRRFNDLWLFDPGTFCWRKVEPKGGMDKAPARMHRMCCVAVGDRLVLFGGKRTPSDLYVLDLSPSLTTLCKLAVLRWRLDPAGLPRDIRWEMEAMTSDGNRDA